MLLMRRSGFNVVRLPIAWSRLEAQRGQVDSAYLGRVADLVARLNRHHRYVVLDVHVMLAWGARLQLTATDSFTLGIGSPQPPC